MGLKEYSPVCAFDLCKFLKVPVYVPSDVPGLASHYLVSLTNDESSSCWSAVTIPVGDDDHIIIHNPTHAGARQQSNLMHEIAHILCEHTKAQDTGNIGLGGCLRSIDGEKEDEAEWLGACLQLPRPALLYCLKRGMNEADIALRYNCSSEMARYRINITGVKHQLEHTKRRTCHFILKNMTWCPKGACVTKEKVVNYFHSSN
jgi:hypothetical protein